MSRKPKINPESIKRICNAIELGATYTIAAEAGGISRATLYNWFDKAKKPRADKQYTEFLKLFTAAESRGALHLLGEVKRHSVKDWRAAAWVLERRHDYKRDKVSERVSEKTISPALKKTPDDYMSLLKEQLSETRDMLEKAKSSESWQAAAALLKSYLSLAGQIRTLEAEEGALDNIDKLPDDQVIREAVDSIITLPPILRQPIIEQINELGVSNVISIQRKK